MNQEDLDRRHGVVSRQGLSVVRMDWGVGLCVGEKGRGRGVLGEASSPGAPPTLNIRRYPRA